MSIHLKVEAELDQNSARAAAEQLNATAYTTGSGSGQPTGIVTSLVGSAGTVPLI